MRIHARRKECSHFASRRHKERTSFVQHVLDNDRNAIPVIRVDMTITTTTAPGEDGGDESDTKYEIELGNDVTSDMPGGLFYVFRSRFTAGV